MKKIIFILTIFTAIATQSFAQATDFDQYCGGSGPTVCTVVILPGPGLYPLADSVAPIIAGVPTYTTIDFQNYDTVINGQNAVDSLTFDSINNLPVGLCWKTNSRTNTFGHEQNGCILISGTTNAAAGQYKLDIYITAYCTLFPTGLMTNTSALGLYYYLRVNCNGTAAIVPIDTGSRQATAPWFIQYNATNCSGGLSLQVSLGSNQSVCGGGVFTLYPAVSGGISPYSYAWSSTGNSLSCNNCENPTVTITTGSSYYVTVTDANSNTASAEVSYIINCGNGYCGGSGPLVCTPGNFPNPGFYPSADTLAPIIDGVPTNTFIEFKNYDTVINGQNSTMDSLTFDSINNLPAGLCWKTNSATNTFGHSQNGCILISGTTNAAAGQYKLDIYITAYFPTGLMTNTSALGLYYYLRVDCNGSAAIVPIDTVPTQASTSAFIAYNTTGCNVVVMGVSLGSTQTVCNGAGVTLNPVITNGQTPYSYSWGESGNSLSCLNCASPTATITQTSRYSVTITDANNNSATASVTYLIGAVGTINISANGPTTFCTGSNVDLSVSGNYSSYRWSTGSTTSIISASQSGNYEVTATSNSGCSSTGNIAVNAVAPPTSQSIIGNPSITPFQNYTYIVNQVSGITYTWSVEGGAIQTGQGTNSISVVWAGSGPYSVTLIQTNAGNCSDTSSLLVINSSCTLQVGLNVVNQSPLCAGDTALLIATVSSNGASFQWVKNGSVIAGATSDTLYITANGNYQVNATGNGCTTLSSVNTIDFNPSPSLPIISGNVTINGCNTQPVTLTLNNTYPSYNWNNGNSTPTTVVTVSGSYVVTVTGSNGCQLASAPYNLNLSIINPVDICIVSVDSASGKNMIVWDNPSLTAIDSFLVYKETAALNVFGEIGGIAGTDFSTFIDVNSNPAQHADRYELVVLDSCGHLTLSSSPQQTIHLSINQGIGNTWNLIWNAYEGFVFPSYFIYRSTTGGVLTQIDVISSSNTSYTDLNPPTGTLNYQVAINNPNGCSPSRSTNYSQSLSNIVNTNSIGIQTVNENNVQMYSYNAEGENIVTVKANTPAPYDFKLFEISGRLVLEKHDSNTTETVLPATLAKGVYVAEAYFTDGSSQKIKVVVR